MEKEMRRSRDAAPHFEKVGGRNVFYDNGWPALILTVEIPWLGLVHGRYRETMGYYDHFYPAAAKMGLTAMKVPVKWAMVEPEKKGRYDFSYLEHVVETARKNGLDLVVGWFGHYASGDGTIYRNMVDEMFAPGYVIEDDRKYPRAVDADGVAHHNAASYACKEMVQVEIAAFRAFMRHMKKIDGKQRTVKMIQVENEIAQFGADRRNRKMWRDHRPEADALFREWKYKKAGISELLFTARLMGEKWLNPLCKAGRKEYPLPQFFNYVSGILAKGTVGGSPGEDIATHLKTVETIDFIGRNLYMQPTRTVTEMRGALKEWCVGGNIPAITETNSGPDPVAPRLAYLSIGEFGAPIFAPWALNISYPGSHFPYVLKDGTLANGAFALRDVYLSLRKAMAQVAWFACTDSLGVFMSEKPGESFQETRKVGGMDISVGGSAGGQGIVIRTGEREILAVGFRVSVGLSTGREKWPNLKSIKVSEGFYRDGNKWVETGTGKYTINQSTGHLRFSLEEPAAARVIW